MGEITQVPRQGDSKLPPGELPAVRAADGSPLEKLEGLKILFEKKIAGRERAVSMMAGLAYESADKALRDRCAEAVGAVLIADATKTTLREHAAKMLGTINSPKALDYLEAALKGDDAAKSKYPTTVRAVAVSAVVSEYSLPMADEKTRARALELLRHVAGREGETFEPRDTARRFLARLDERKARQKG